MLQNKGYSHKFRVSTPPEDGKTNKAICKLLAEALGVKASQVSIESGAASPEKIMRVAGVTTDDLRQLVA